MQTQLSRLLTCLGVPHTRACGGYNFFAILSWKHEQRLSNAPFTVFNNSLMKTLLLFLTFVWFVNDTQAQKTHKIHQGQKCLVT